MFEGWEEAPAAWSSAALLHMNSAIIPPLTALMIQSALGVSVFYANPRRRANQCFLLLSVAIGAWLVALFLGLRTNNPATAELCVREASAAGAIILTLFNILRFSILRSSGTWFSILRASWLWIAAGLIIVALCQTKFFLHDVHFTAHVNELRPPPIPTYGRGFVLFIAYFVIATTAVLAGYIQDVRRTTGREHAELSFVLIGTTSALAFSLLLTFLLRLFIEPAQLVWFAPFRIVLFSLVIAYGVATRKIMEVGFFLRRAMSYAVLTAYLVALYTFVWWIFYKAMGPLLGEARSIGYLVAAVVVAFAMAPARGVSQSFADRLFIGTRGLDFRTTMSKAAAILGSVTTLSDLLRRFASTIGEAVGTDNVTIFLAQRKTFRNCYALAASSTVIDELPADAVLVQWLNSHREPLVLDELHRVRSTASTVAIQKTLNDMRAATALGIFAREHLVGIMVLGPRLSGRIYGSVEQNALQVLCGQLAVAIENAELFTEVQNAKIYNEILLQNLTTGVIAADADGRISVFNREAEKITGLKAKTMLEKTISDLPVSLGGVIQATLTSRERQEDREIYLRSISGGVYARASSSTFHGQDRQLLGALAVITDITALKRLELQIRRSDRLASLGTLSAGMAHEIKNPLVSIKTFAQLLPERYSDSDFRETFSNLIVHEIDRIDSLVNQLLRFARPAKPLLQPMHVHEVLEKTLLLVQHRLYQKEIKLTRSWDAEVDTIHADADQLEQVFLNFFLNAMDAMRRGGELTVGTQIRSGDPLVPQLSLEGEDTREALCISIRDTGDGIRAEDIPHVFDPFFTTKDYGTGLGLSVVHGIIEEHGGQIEVESELSKGTAFHIFLPLVRFDQKVVAA
jgi:PAS domain S-box-containing protein